VENGKRLGPLRYAELRKLIPKLSDKVLSQRLHELTEAGLIERSRPDGDKVEVYALAPRAQSLSVILTELYSWGDINAAEFGVEVGHPLKSTNGLQGG
jgi:DNA-binding HxlR family transcriptional regulator